ncbi:MAG: sigma-54-dependent transcriptional regulator [Bacillota bacterium]
MKRRERIRTLLAQLCAEERRGFDATEVADRLGAARHNVSADLNELAREGLVVKQGGRPVLFWDPAVWATVQGQSAAAPPAALAAAGAAGPQPSMATPPNDPFTALIGAGGSLRRAVEQAKAAVLYPPAGLDTLLIGPTGVGKSHMAELMHQFAVSSGRFTRTAPFITFNCADYAANPQLLMGQLFGVTKGAYTGADRDREGMVEQANGGMLFLDEIHRLPPEGQEMLFRLIDKGLVRRLGESGRERPVQVMLIGATTERPDSVLLATFTRRIPMVITLSSLAERTLEERLRFIKRLLRGEAEKIGLDLLVPQETLRMLLEYECLGNIGQLKSDLQLACARLFLAYLTESPQRERGGSVTLLAAHLPDHVVRTVPPVRERRPEVADLLDGLGGPLVIQRKGSLVEQPGGDLAPVTFYERIEQQLASLRQQGVDLAAAGARVRADIESHFQAFLARVKRRHQSHRQELANLVGQHVLRAVEKAMLLAEDRLGRAIPERILYSLALHIHATLERRAGGHPLDWAIELPEPDGPEGAVAREVVAILSAELATQLPRSDVTFVAMLLRPESEAEPSAGTKLGIIVLGHGRVPSAMAEVANALTGSHAALAIDMPLDQSPEAVEEQLVAIAQSGEYGGGLLLLADMGSLEQVGNAVAVRTGLPVRTVTLVATPLVVEAVHQASVPEATLDQVYQSVLSARQELLRREGGAMLPQVVLTFCFTGIGGAQTLARMARAAIGDTRAVEVIPAAIHTGTGWNRLVTTLVRTHRLLAVIGPFQPRLPGVPYISTEEMVMGTGEEKLRRFLRGTGAEPPAPPAPAGAPSEGGPELDGRILSQMAANLAVHLKATNPAVTIPAIARALQTMETYLEAPLEESVRVGLMLHLACVLDRKVESRLQGATGSEAPAGPYNGPLPWLPEALSEITTLFRLTFSAEELERLAEILLASVSQHDEVSR